MEKDCNIEIKELKIAITPEDSKALKKKVIIFIIIISISAITEKITENEEEKESKIDESRINFISTGLNEFNYVKNNYDSFKEKLPTYYNTHITSKNIFWCWFQGLENAPIISKSCLKSIRINCPDYNIIIINNKNMHNYVHFPNYILEKFKNKYMTPTHFSDLLRLELLIKYGGTWIDASVLVTKFEERFFNSELFFFQQRTAGCVGSSWFITSEKANPILITARDLLYEYWRKRDNLCNYFLFHLFIKMACEKYVNSFRNIPYFSNYQPHILQSYLKKKYSEAKYNEILKIISIHKLTVKLSQIPGDSFFNHIIETYYPK